LKVQLNKGRINLSAPACACSHADRCNLPAAPTAQVDAQAEDKTSKMLEVVLEEKRREEWINSGRIKDINNET